MSIQQLQSLLNEAANKKDLVDQAVLCRKVLSSCVEFLYAKAGREIPENATLLELLDGDVVSPYVADRGIIKSLHYVRILGMNAEHERHVKKSEVKLALDNMTYLVGLLAAKEEGRDASYRQPPYMSELVTRRLYIDLFLKEAGWEVLRTDNLIQAGKAGIEIEVEGMHNASGKGYCDYVLYGRDGKPLAIVEVKKTSVDVNNGRKQVNDYADCMEAKYGYRPVLYYTNAYETKIIDGIYPDRPVSAFHSLEDLEWMIRNRERKPISDLSINPQITGRHYQIRAITRICERLNSNFRKALLVMATGTGKTRVAISIVDVLTRNHWIKSVLFLADRTALVNQAKRNFAIHLPEMTICELSASGEKDYNARLMFCTYQTMINYIDAEDKRFSTGRFDLIIVDEAHRSIFNRYGSIFSYFDSFLIGLTATPKDEVEANTYDIFGCEPGQPTDDYSLEEAIHDHYLVGYKVINRTSKLLSEGIDYGRLTDEQKKQLDEYLRGQVPTPDFNISAGEIFRYLYNERTCLLVLEELMQSGYRVDGGETLGKTIIFAYNHKHAQMIVDCFRKYYPMYPANYCQLIDNTVKGGDDLILKFDDDPEFRIAVSVDMLDTGVDIPAVLNLVFFKTVRSKIKFVQMIGRGTRLCENVYGPGKNKSGFLIFDYCGNFEYFDMHPDGGNLKEPMTLSQRIFDVKLDMLYELQRLEYQEDVWFHAYYDQIKKQLHSQAVQIKHNDKRRQVRDALQYVDQYYDYSTWASLSPVMVIRAKKYLTPLVDSGLEGSYLEVAFDARMYYVELSVLAKQEIKTVSRHIKRLRSIAKYLLDEKASLDQVLTKANDLRELMSEDFWLNPSIPEMERLRLSLRGLMPFLADAGKGKVDINIDDIILPSDYQPEDTAIDIRTYREKVMDYLAENTDHEVIRKIRNLEPISQADLEELEKILWHDLGTRADYQNTTEIGNIAAFVRSLIGLEQDAVNQQLGEYLTGNTFNSQQQEFLKNIVDYVRENGDIEVGDLVNKEPFDNFDLTELFGERLKLVVSIVNLLHSRIMAA